MDRVNLLLDFFLDLWVNKEIKLLRIFFYAFIHLRGFSVGFLVLRWVATCRRMSPRWQHQSLRLSTLSEALSFTVWTSVISCCVNDGRMVWTRMMRCVCVCACVRTPSPTSPSPPPTLHHMMAWVGLPLWVTQLWGTVLARPLSPVSEPRLMTADDDPVVFPPSHTPSLPTSPLQTFNRVVFFSFICFSYYNHIAETQ